MPLLGRRYRLVVGTLDVSELDIAFRVERTLKPEPNKAKIQIYNLTHEHRVEVMQRTKGRFKEEKGGKDPGDSAANASVLLEAGYRDQISTIFVGNTRDVYPERAKADWSLHIIAGDGAQFYRRARINKTYKAGTPYGTIIYDCAKAMGVGLGNVRDFLGAEVQSIGKTVRNGLTLSGRAADELDALLRSAGISWSIQSEVLQLQPVGDNGEVQPLRGTAVDLSPETGLIDSPAIDEKGFVKARALIVPGLDPGRRVKLTSDLISGNFQIREVLYQGDSKGQEWFADLKMKAW